MAGRARFLTGSHNYLYYNMSTCSPLISTGIPWPVDHAYFDSTCNYGMYAQCVCVCAHVFTFTYADKVCHIMLVFTRASTTMQIRYNALTCVCVHMTMAMMTMLVFPVGGGKAFTEQLPISGMHCQTTHKRHLT